MRPIQFTLQYADAVTDSIATVQTLGSAGNLTLDGALVVDVWPNTYVNENVAPTAVAQLSPQGFVTITSTDDLSAMTFTIVGADAAGNPLSEEVVGPNNETVLSTLAFTTVTSVACDGAASNVSVGTAEGGYTPWMPLDIYVKNQDVDIQVTLVSGSATYSMVYTNEDPFNPAITQEEIAVDSSLTSAVASVNYQSTKIMRALRLKVADGSTGLLRVTITQQSTR